MIFHTIPENIGIYFSKLGIAGIQRHFLDDVQIVGGGFVHRAVSILPKGDAQVPVVDFHHPMPKYCSGSLLNIL